MIGLGDKNAKIKVYIENRPPLPPYQTINTVIPLPDGEIKNIGDKTGNHWRKIFNVYAKLMFEFEPTIFHSWQALRDKQLLQANSKQCLLFSPPQFTQQLDNADLHIIMGKTYAQKLSLTNHCYWLNQYFAVNEQQKIIITPYFDYRQLSNIKISQLVQLIKQIHRL